VEEFMPAFQQPLLLLLYQFQDSIDFLSGEPETAFQQDRIEPNFRLVVFAFHMDMGRLIPVTRIEEKPVGSRSQYGGHPPMLQAQQDPGYPLEENHHEMSVLLVSAHLCLRRAARPRGRSQERQG
jgi:hypothetical protein